MKNLLLHCFILLNVYTNNPVHQSNAIHLCTADNRSFAFNDGVPPTA